MKRIGHYRIIKDNGLHIVYGRNCEPIDKFGEIEDAEAFVYNRIELIDIGNKMIGDA